MPRSIAGCGVSHIGEVARSDGGVEKRYLISRFISDIHPLALRALPLSHLRWAEGEDWNVTSSVLNFSIAVPRSITGCGVSHIREVAHSDGEVEKDNMFFAWRFNPLALRALPLSHLRWAEGEDWNVTSNIFRLLHCRHFLTPPSYGHLPYILHSKTQGRKVFIFLTEDLYIALRHPVNAMGHGRGGGFKMPLQQWAINPYQLSNGPNIGLFLRARRNK